MYLHSTMCAACVPVVPSYDDVTTPLLDTLAFLSNNPKRGKSTIGLPSNLPMTNEARIPHRLRPSNRKAEGRVPRKG